MTKAKKTLLTTFLMFSVVVLFIGVVNLHSETRRIFCGEVFPTICPGGDCLVEEWKGEDCVIYGCDEEPWGVIECDSPLPFQINFK
jgi:hypothetical protein